MKIYITGTTRGLGKQLVKAFEKNFIFSEITELNRPKWDISISDDRLAMAGMDFDVFVNNAHDGFSQVELLYDLFAMNKDRNCTIVNIGSVSADGDRKEVNPYAIQKKALDAACTQLQLVKSKCRIIQIKPGHMDTNMISHIKTKKMDPWEVAKLVVWVTEQSQNSIIKTITMDNKL